MTPRALDDTDWHTQPHTTPTYQSVKSVHSTQLYSYRYHGTMQPWHACGTASRGGSYALFLPRRRSSARCSQDLGPSCIQPCLGEFDFIFTADPEPIADRRSAACCCRAAAAGPIGRRQQASRDAAGPRPLVTAANVAPPQPCCCLAAEQHCGRFVTHPWSLGI
eukprot:COSAG01_NODE_6199_length_3798_cov_11.251690_7_plen_164_part_00